ncbi:voltage-dependent calcium channel gamma-5 subunit [Elysia marginata]|uniref:Voltage-dependent calcium channel gamma-5 subunit n=1 Tax=Elysia marginata TaxID=1093978 RepID=A0AAV4H2N8_9GAST|nr:voltage-dependent calcium channel gamma-5 subunit [Elysia marginata]
MSACATTLIVIATILGPVTLVFMSVSFGTDHWLEFRVDRSKLTSDVAPSDWQKARYYRSRDRGIFRECYPDNNTECKYLYMYVLINSCSISCMHIM